MAKTEGYSAKRRALEEELKAGKFRPCYLVYGDEDYLRLQTGERIVSTLSAGLNDMNVTTFAGADVREEEVIDLACTMPFFADYRLIVVKNAGLFTTGEHPLASYLNAQDNTVRIVFLEEKADKRSSLYKAAEKNGMVICCETLSEEMLATWIGRRMKEGGRKVETKAVQLLLEKAGTDMMCLQHETDKLIAYTAGRDSVTVTDVETVCASYLRGKIFDLTDALSEQNRKGAMDVYYDLLSLKEPPQRILFLIMRQLNLMLQAADLDAQGAGQGAIAEALHLQPFIAGKYRQWASRFGKKKLKTLLTHCMEQDTAVKQGRLNERISVEMLIVEATANGDG